MGWLKRLWARHRKRWCRCAGCTIRRALAGAPPKARAVVALRLLHEALDEGGSGYLFQTAARVDGQPIAVIAGTGHSAGVVADLHAKYDAAYRAAVASN